MTVILIRRGQRYLTGIHAPFRWTTNRHAAFAFPTNLDFVVKIAADIKTEQPGNTPITFEIRRYSL